MSRHIDIDTLQDWLTAERPVTILDVRNEAARAQWSIPESLHVATPTTSCVPGSTAAWSLEGGMKAWSLGWNRAEIPIADPDVRVLQLRRAGKGCQSYLVASAGDAVVIAPSLPAHAYQRLVEREGWTLRHV